MLKRRRQAGRRHAVGRVRRIRWGRRNRSAAPRIRGHGGYFTDALRGAGRAVQRAGRRVVPRGTFSRLGAAGGGALGGRYGLGSLGSAAGGLLGNTISKLVGFGDYKVMENTLVKDIDMGHSIPAFGDQSAGTVIRHREFLADVRAPASTAFNLTFRIPINPGLASSFPWLAQIAGNYQQYHIRGMVFEFISTSSEYSTNAGLGSVVLATEYDVTKPAFVSKLAMENSQFCVSGKPSVDIMHPIECAKAVTNNPIKYVRTSPVPVNEDQRLFDWANFELAQNGIAATAGTGMGELWVSYDICLLKPVLNIGNEIPMDHFILPITISSSAYLTGALSSLPSVGNYSGIGGVIGTSTYSFPVGVSAGNYILCYAVLGATTTLSTAMGVTLSNCVGNNIHNNDANSVIFNSTGSTSNTQFRLDFITVTASPCTVQYSSGTLPGTITAGDLYVVQMPSADIPPY